MQIMEHMYLLPFGDNSLYLIVDGGEAALIDAHVGGQAEKVLEAVEEVVDLSQLKTVVITHGHLDHVGACPLLEERTSAVFAAHVADAGMVEDPWLQFLETLCRFQSPTEERYRSFLGTVGGRGVKVGRMLRDGDVLRVGACRLEVVHTPGHSPGSLCLYDLQAKALVTGDAVQGAEKFLPGWFGLVVDARSYWASLQRLSEMEVEVFLPAHYDVRRGLEAKKDIYSSMERFKVIESGILEILGEEEGLPLSEIKDRIVERVLGARRGEDSDVELYSVHAYVQKLCYEGKLIQEKGLVWRKVSVG